MEENLYERYFICVIKNSKVEYMNLLSNLNALKTITVDTLNLQIFWTIIIGVIAAFLICLSILICVLRCKSIDKKISKISNLSKSKKHSTKKTESKRALNFFIGINKLQSGDSKAIHLHGHYHQKKK